MKDANKVTVSSPSDDDRKPKAVRLIRPSPPCRVLRTQRLGILCAGEPLLRVLAPDVPRDRIDVARIRSGQRHHVVGTRNYGRRTAQRHGLRLGDGLRAGATCAPDRLWVHPAEWARAPTEVRRRCRAAIRTSAPLTTERDEATVRPRARRRAARAAEPAPSAPATTARRARRRRSLTGPILRELTGELVDSSTPGAAAVEQPGQPADPSAAQPRKASRHNCTFCGSGVLGALAYRRGGAGVPPPVT